MLDEIRHVSALLPSLQYDTLDHNFSYNRHIVSYAVSHKLLPSSAQICTNARPSSFFIPRQVKFNTNRLVTLRQTKDTLSSLGTLFVKQMDPQLVKKFSNFMESEI